MANKVLYSALLFLAGWVWYFVIIRQFVFNLTTARPMLNRFKKLDEKWNEIISINSFRYLTINIIVWVLISLGIGIVVYILTRKALYLFIAFLFGAVVGLITCLGQYTEYTERNFKDFCATYYRFIFDDELRTAMYNSQLPAIKARLDEMGLDQSVLIPKFKN